jgi:hypothetical protein
VDLLPEEIEEEVMTRAGKRKAPATGRAEARVVVEALETATVEENASA